MHCILFFFQWPSFFPDLLQCFQFGSRAVDMYLRILKAIDEEVVDRDTVRSPQVHINCIMEILSR